MDVLIYNSLVRRSRKQGEKGEMGNSFFFIWLILVSLSTSFLFSSSCYHSKRKTYPIKIFISLRSCFVIIPSLFIY